MQRSTRALIAVTAAIGVGAVAYGFTATAAGSAPTTESAEQDADSDDSDAPLTGTDLEQAVAAALEHTGGGEVVDSEIGDDGAAFGVEIVLDDGSQVEVNLDADFVVIGSEPDDD